jgi:predicted porin
MGATSIRLGYSTWNGNGTAGQKDDVKMGAGVRYSLSKRTYLHANVATQTRKNNTGTRPDRDNTKNTLFDTGVVHAF